MTVRGTPLPASSVLRSRGRGMRPSPPAGTCSRVRGRRDATDLTYSTDAASFDGPPSHTFTDPLGTSTSRHNVSAADDPCLPLSMRWTQPSYVTHRRYRAFVGHATNLHHGCFVPRNRYQEAFTKPLLRPLRSHSSSQIDPGRSRSWLTPPRNEGPTTTHSRPGRSQPG